MPRNDRTGPLGAGPRTGRGLGRCGRSSAGGRSVDSSYWDEGAGRGGRRWRGRGVGNGGRGRGWGFGLGGRPSRDPDQAEGTTHRMQAFLRRLIRELTAQLDGLSRPPSTDSSEGARDRE
jgi:hypothetical protein